MGAGGLAKAGRPYQVSKHGHRRGAEQADESMSDLTYTLPGDRGLIGLSGADASGLLQGLVSNDIGRVSPERAVYAALLTPQGKFLHDFLVSRIGDGFFLDCEAARLADLRKRLALYRLRADVAIAAPAEGMAVAIMTGAGALSALGLPAEAGAARAFEGGVAYVDPRLPDLGARAVLPAEHAARALAALGFAAADGAAYEDLRLHLGIPDGGRDMLVEKATLLESNFEELNGVDWDKGCYVGQEVTARMHYRGLIRKRLLPVAIDGPTPDPETPVMYGKREAGEMRSAANGRGLALLKLALVEEAAKAGEALTAGEARLTPEKPDWAAF